MYTFSSAEIHLFYHLLHLVGLRVSNLGPLNTLAQCLTNATNSLQSTIKTPEY